MSKPITMKLCTRSLVLLSIVVTRTSGAIYNEVSQLPTYAYDYIIVGGTFFILYGERK